MYGCAISLEQKKKPIAPMKKNMDEQQLEAVTESDDKINAVHNKVKFEVFGEEMLEKSVKSSGNSGRVYLPPDWVGHRVKIIRID